MKPIFPLSLQERLLDLPDLAIAFSGGLDSRFLAHAAQRLGLDPLCLHLRGPHVPDSESRAAEAWARARGLDFCDFEFNPLKIPEVASGNPERCYHCKKALMTFLLKALSHISGAHTSQSEGTIRNYQLADGSNASDSLEYRPGQRALRELGVHSPLAEANISKENIRGLAALSGMDRPEQKARPCLLTRFAYNLPPDAATLALLEKSEEKITDFLLVWRGGLLAGVDFRLRVPAPGEYLLQLTPHIGQELPTVKRDELRQGLLKLLDNAGLDKVSVEYSHQISGHFDRHKV